jgi:hypothetical protein
MQVTLLFSFEAEANLGAPASKVRITSTVYDLDTGKVAWVNQLTPVSLTNR